MSAQLPVTSEPTCRELNEWVFNMIRKSWPEVEPEAIFPGQMNAPNPHQVLPLLTGESSSVDAVNRNDA